MHRDHVVARRFVNKRGAGKPPPSSVAADSCLISACRDIPRSHVSQIRYRGPTSVLTMKNLKETKRQHPLSNQSRSHVSDRNQVLLNWQTTWESLEIFMKNEIASVKFSLDWESREENRATSVAFVRPPVKAFAKGYACPSCERGVSSVKVCCLLPTRAWRFFTYPPPRCWPPAREARSDGRERCACEEKQSAVRFHVPEASINERCAFSLSFTPALSCPTRDARAHTDDVSVCTLHREKERERERERVGVARGTEQQTVDHSRA